MKPTGLSPEALAKALNVSPSHIIDIVRERRSISTDVATLLSAYFGTSGAYIMSTATGCTRELAGKRKPERLASHLFFSADRKTVNIDARFDDDTYIGELPLDGSDFKLWQKIEGFYDHAQVPLGDRWGPGTRIPALIVSPFARKGFVDKTQYDTGSILRFITHRWSLAPLPGIVERDAGLAKNGSAPMGDLSGALQFGAVSPR